MHAYNYWPVQIFCSEMLFLCVLKYNISPKCINYTVLLLVNMMLPYQQFPNLCEKVKRPNEAMQQEKTCNCRKKEECPLGNKCLTRSVIYQATVETDEERQTYIGMTDTEFKTRYRNHKQSFERDRYEGQTELSKFIWSLKRSSIPFHISWEIVDRATSYSPITKRCNLCILEKYYILRHKERASLNKRSELASNCRQH